MWNENTFEEKVEAFWKQLTFKIFWSKNDATWIATCTHPDKRINESLAGLSGLSLVLERFRSEGDALNMLRAAVEEAFELFEEEEVEETP